MKEEIKKYSPELSLENDFLAKETAVSFLESTGRYCLQTPLNNQIEVFKDYDFEIFDNKKQSLITVEVERKKVWTKTGEWQGWSTIDIPYRKKDSKADIFIMTNVNCSTIAATIVSRILKSPNSTKKTIYTNNERFYNVDINQFKFFHYNLSSWNRFL